MIYKRWFLFVFSLAIVFLGGCGGGGTPKTWNYLVYMDGDNNLEQWGIFDLNEMEQVGSTSRLNVLVLFDRHPAYDTSNGNWTGTRLYLVTIDNNQNNINSTLLQDYGELDMSNPNTLRDSLFIANRITLPTGRF